MDTGRAALIFFFGLFWASALSGIAEFRTFDTASLFRAGRRAPAARRLVVGFTIANLLPAIGLWWLYRFDFILPSGAGGGAAVMSAALASLSVFSVPRLLHAFIATRPVYQAFYSESEWCQVVSDARAEITDSFWAHFIPGVAYIAVFWGLAWLVQRVFVR